MGGKIAWVNSVRDFEYRGPQLAGLGSWKAGMTAKNAGGPIEGGCEALLFEIWKMRFRVSKVSV